MTSVTRAPITGADSAVIRTALADLLDRHRGAIDGASRVLVVPDVHYPHHPSTGLVTDPTVVEELLGLIDADAAIGVAPSEYVDGDRAAAFLDYDGIADRTGAELLDLGDADRIERRVPFVDESVSIAVPAPLVENAVVPVPTLRRSPRRGVAAGMTTLARAVTEDPTRKEVLAATRARWPDLTIVDGSIAYRGDPERTDVLLASEDVVAATEAAADLLDVDRSEVPHLVSRRSPPSPLGSIGKASSDDGPAAGDGLAAKGYRLYARFTGDLVPPQMLPRGERE